MIKPDFVKHNKIYWPQLEGVRTLAFFLVFLSHVGAIPVGSTNNPIGNLVAIYNRVIAWGWIGVDLFFCLSGFLITSLLLREHREFGSISYRDFFARRALRIWPLYYFVLLTSCFFVPLFGCWGVTLGDDGWYAMIRTYFPAFAFFLGNIPVGFYATTIGISPFFVILWSVCVEEQFYLAWGGFLRHVQRPKFLWGTIATIFVVNLAFRAYLIHGAVNHLPYYYNTLSRLDPILMGCVLGIINVAHVEHWNWLAQWKRQAALLAGVMFLGQYLCIPPLGTAHALHEVLFTTTALACGLLIFAVMTWEPLTRLFSNKVLVQVGKVTYGMYLFHYLGLLIAPMIVGRFVSNDVVIWTAKLVGGFAITYALSLASWRFLETPFNRRRSRYGRVLSKLDDSPSLPTQTVTTHGSLSGSLATLR